MAASTESETQAFVRAQTRPARHPLVPEITLRLASRITPIWTASEESLATSGVEPPYWAFCWPGGAATARFLLDHPERVTGRRVMDIAAGSGVAAIAAAKAGAAWVSAHEIDAYARAAVAVNARANNVAIDIPAGDPLDAVPPADAVILAGDVCYQRDMAARMIDWLRRAHAAGAEVWLADPGRAYLPEIGIEECARYTVPTSLELEDREMRETVLYRLTG
ncbi:MAG: methyltransferase [Alphaproteobacteria bacterium]|nr:methyltransferase [Alphaproteobacteria bacterium]